MGSLLRVSGAEYALQHSKITESDGMLESFCRKCGTMKIGSGGRIVAALLGTAVLSAMSLGAGFHLGEQATAAASAPAAKARIESIEALQTWVDEEKAGIEVARKQTEDHLDALAMRLARLQAQMMRVDAVGERLVKLGKLDAAEFDFGTPPAVGGPDEAEPAEGERTQSASDLISDMETLERLLHQRKEQLSVLEEWLMTNEIERQTTPTGLPVLAGWISSGFGSRINPVTGKRQRHAGVDIPGIRGEDVISVAAGAVTRSERVSGYGNMIEIRHADGYTTRYAHNQTNLVEEGDRVEQSQVIALLGSSGRATGAHVHFEVRKDGDPVDPSEFIGKEG